MISRAGSVTVSVTVALFLRVPSASQTMQRKITPFSSSVAVTVSVGVVALASVRLTHFVPGLYCHWYAVAFVAVSVNVAVSPITAV